MMALLGELPAARERRKSLRGPLDIKVCAVDEIWSGLCFAHRRK